MRLRKKLIFTLIISILVLSGCAPKVDTEIIEYVKKIKEKKIKYIKKIPKIPEVSLFEYTAFEFRDPFTPYSIPTAEAGAPSMQSGPDLNRSREPLETFPLDSLEMVGTIEQDNIFFALIKNASGAVYRVSVGNYLGQNSGKIEKINASEISVKEWLSNTKDGWREHVITIPLLNKSVKKKGA